MSAASKNLVRFLCAGVAVILLAAGLNFVVDPLQYFRPARLFHAMYSPDSRMQNAGLIHSQRYDTVFMGTSLAIHFRQSDIDRHLGGRSVKLAMTGSNSHEQSFVLDAALARHPKRVLWQVDDWIFRDAPEIDADIYLPADLYRRDAKGIAGYLFSGSMARESLWILARSIPPLQTIVARLTTGVVFKFPYADIDDINTLSPKLDPAQVYNANAMLAAFTRATAPQNRVYLQEGYNYDEMVRNFERDAVGLFEKYPDVEFDIYFPPYSILQFVAMRDYSPQTLQIVYQANRYLLRRLAQFANVEVYDFREAKEITHDLNNYSDIIHHSPAVDLKILEMIAADKYRMDRSAPEASLERLKSQIEAYRLGE
jgi:hypothetical protein